MKKMKIGKLIMCVCIITLLTAASGYGSDFNFRKTKWGMSEKEVLASEKMKPASQDKNSIDYSTQVLNKNVLLSYSFIQDKLVQAYYLLRENHTDHNKYITDYEDFKKIIFEKYGNPAVDEYKWTNNLFRGQSDKYGLALASGHVFGVAVWNTELTEISTYVGGDNFEILCSVRYLSLKHKDLIKQKKSEKQKEKENF